MFRILTRRRKRGNSERIHLENSKREKKRKFLKILLTSLATTHKGIGSGKGEVKWS